MGISNTEQVNGARRACTGSPTPRGFISRSTRTATPGRGSTVIASAADDVMGLGSRGLVTLANARVAAQEAAALVRKGLDPVDERKPSGPRTSPRRRLNPSRPSKRWPKSSSRSMAATGRAATPARCGGACSSFISFRRSAISSSRRSRSRTSPRSCNGRRTRARQDCASGADAHRAGAQPRHRSVRRGDRQSGRRQAAPLKPPKVERPHFKAVELDEAPAVFRELKAQAAAHAAR